MLLKSWLEKSTPAGLLFLGIIVGVGGACGAALFHALIYLSTLLFYGHDGTTGFLALLENLSTWKRILIPTLGGLLVGLIYKIAKVNEAEKSRKQQRI